MNTWLITQCEVIGHYDPLRDDTYFSLLDSNDPSKGVSMKYLYGNKCPSGNLRTTTIDIECWNVPYVILSALEPETCQYHMTMRSMYGCPQVGEIYFYSLISYFIYRYLHYIFH